MTQQTSISFDVPTTNTDGTPITEALTYTLSIDTVNPPVKTYPVPAANVSAAVAGVITVKFGDIAFTPVHGTVYYVDVTATDADGTSNPSGVVSFTYVVVPNPPSALKVF